MPRQTPALPACADVVIIGGGAIGTSAAFHLAEAGVDVVLLERNELGSGSTSRAAGGVRAQFSDALNIEISNRSLAAFKSFGARPGWEIDFKPVGYLFVLSREEDVATFEANVAMQNAYGVPSRMLSPREVKDLSPLVHGDDILGGAFSAEDGHCTPEGVVQGYAFAARAYGAHVRTHCEVLEIVMHGAEIREVVTPNGSIKTNAVICAAGPWSARCGEMVGVTLPVSPLRRQIMCTEPIPDLPARIPMTIDFASTFYFHREGPGLLYGMSDRDETFGFKSETSDDWIPALTDIAERRAPVLARAGVQTGWAGLYEMSPDHNAVIGESQGVARFLYATGFSGHGFLQAPAVGEILRDLVLERPTFVDITPLSLERFGRSELRPEFNIV